MKLPIRLASAVIAAAVAVAGCGDSADKSRSTRAERMDVTPSANQVKEAVARGSAKAGSSSASAKKAAAKAQSAAKAAASPKAKRSAAKADAAATAQAGKISLPNVSIFQISTKSAYPMAGIVGARAPFQLRFSSSDGHPHVVRISTPKPRTLNIPASESPTRLTFPGMKPGSYTLSVDGSKDVATLAVMDQKSFNKKPTVSAAQQK